MTTVRDIETFLYAWAPRETAESWDNVGLLVGRGDREVRRVLAALDVTPAVAAEAAELGADLIVAHHPVMNVRWHEREMQTLRDDTRPIEQAGTIRKVYILCHAFAPSHKYFLRRYSACSGVMTPSLISAKLMLPYSSPHRQSRMEDLVFSPSL